MAGTLVPVVLFPRFTTLSGPTTFMTVAMDVTDYDQALVDFWRSAGANSPVVSITFEESNDQLGWTTCSGGPFNDPGANSQLPFAPVLTKRWMRISVTLTGTGATVTLWCLGFLVVRES
jgi:hypothetical protein